jgi:hypothetical protein
MLLGFVVDERQKDVECGSWELDGMTKSEHNLFVLYVNATTCVEESDNTAIAKSRAQHWGSEVGANQEVVVKKCELAFACIQSTELKLLTVTVSSNPTHLRDPQISPSAYIQVVCTAVRTY